MCNLLTKALNITVTDFSILKGPRPVKSVNTNVHPFSTLGQTVISQMTNALGRHVNRISLGEFTPETGKIPAIKALRGITCMGLAESKWAVENWAKWIQFVGYEGEYPHINTYDGVLSH